ncbi:PrsW family intramembrane metalloprotease [Candidatus Bathyarchaeota archaeon]|nr:PrsW family intramembrane metalloprotease [Candidatus Bathyarchaeota archaeon]
MASLDLLLVMAVAPGLFFLWFFWVRDKYEREPARLLLSTFLLGALAIIPALILETIGGLVIAAPEEGSSPVQTLLHYFIVIAFVEESMKYLAVRVKAYRSKEFNEVMDGIVYSSAAALGFATVENILYVLPRGLGVGLLRAVLSVPGHALDSGMFGFFLGLAKVRGGTGLVCAGLMVATFFHGLWDSILSLGGDLLLVLLVYSSQWVVVALMMRRAARLSPFRERVIPALIPLIRQRWAATCPKCGRPLVFIERYSGWFCYSCRRYASEPASMGIPSAASYLPVAVRGRPPQEAPPIAHPGTKYCINCRFLMPESSRYCSRCGAAQS